MTMLAIEDLEVSHGQLVAVRDMSFSVEKGEILALVGANGAGKTTLLRSIAGAHAPSSGRILLRGEEITLLPANKRVAAGLALVPEGRRLFPDMTVEENLLLGASVGRPGHWNLASVYDAFPLLVDRRSAKASSLSGGEQQATAIGRALMSNPSLVLLDEVSLGLAPLAVRQVYVSLHRLLESGATIVLVEQDLTRAMSVASRVICMSEGKIRLDRPIADVTRDEITQAYFGLTNAGGDDEATAC